MLYLKKIALAFIGICASPFMIIILPLHLIFRWKSVDIFIVMFSKECLWLEAKRLYELGYRPKIQIGDNPTNQTYNDATEDFLSPDRFYLAENINHNRCKD